MGRAQSGAIDKMVDRAKADPWSFAYQVREETEHASSVATDQQNARLAMFAAALAKEDGSNTQ